MSFMSPDILLDSSNLATSVFKISYISFPSLILSINNFMLVSYSFSECLYFSNMFSYLTYNSLYFFSNKLSCFCLFASSTNSSFALFNSSIVSTKILL
uniref:Uncharacterized protein n=1 Tax=viral metagenome TaxID=1070528 RepID=A0A6C0JBA5_9ZZZZ